MRLKPPFAEAIQSHSRRLQQLIHCLGPNARIPITGANEAIVTIRGYKELYNKVTDSYNDVMPEKLHRRLSWSTREWLGRATRPDWRTPSSSKGAAPSICSELFIPAIRMISESSISSLVSSLCVDCSTDHLSSISTERNFASLEFLDAARSG